MLLAGCQEPADGRSDTIPVFFGEFRGIKNPATIDEVENIFGMDVRTFDSPFGAIHIYIYDEPVPGSNGATYASSDCSVSLWTIERSQTVAHEIGHALTLSHVSDPTNLMNDDGHNDAVGLTEEQIDTARFRAWEFEECRKQL